MQKLVLILVAALTAFLVDPGAVEARSKSKTVEAAPAPSLDAGTFAGLHFRSLGPAVTSGRISDIAVHPRNPNLIYVATAAGGLWKTTNHGVTWTPIFDDQGSSSLGCITLDPNNPNIVWLGTGENNSQRSVGYGDGIYKSLDGGATWKKMGLENSEHIAKIVVDPRDSKVVYVAAQGPLWSAGGDRGLFKTVDGGETWENVKPISEHTGMTDLLMDPRNPDVLIAAAYQRRRHVWTLINGGPESALYKSTDAGKTWRQLKTGLPSANLGRIGLAQSSVDPDVVYAIVEAAEGGGFFRSTDGGETWKKRSGYVSGSPQYYQEIITDPHDVDRIYSMDTWMQVSHDGGATWQEVGERAKHVDNHAMWIDPTDPSHLLAGCDGGLYETWDRGENWKFFPNLPITQFYRLTVSEDAPFYYVYGGTQDNFTLGGPARTHTQHGIRNSDWFVTVGGDGFQPQVDPENPDLIYSQWQYGNLVRYDRASGEMTQIQPKADQDGEPLVWNWDAPLLISPHDAKTLYFAADRLFRSTDRGHSWQAISGDLTRGLDRNTLPVMGRVWSMDAVSKNRSTSIYGNAVTLSESPLEKGLLYVGTDDGLIHVSENGGDTWRKIESFPGVPGRTYVNRVRASRFDASTVFAAFNNHKMGDFKPYLLKSTDRGRTWTSIAGDADDGGLPGRGSVYAVEQDPAQANLLYVGTEFGAFFSLDGGERWIRFKGGLPTVAVRDLVVQEREGDLVLGTFGRGFYVLDDLSPLREASEALLEQDLTVFSVRDAWAYHPALPMGLPGKSFQGDDFYIAENPPFGAVFTYFLKDGLKTPQERRQAAEEEARENGDAIAYPSLEALRAEREADAPAVLLTVRDAGGHVVRRLEGPVGKGFHRIAWDLRYPAPNPVELQPQVSTNPFIPPTQGPPVVPGTYTVTVQTVADDQVADHGSVSFEVKSLALATLESGDREAMAQLHAQVADLQRAVLGAGAALGQAADRVAHLKKAIRITPAADPAWAADIRALEETVRALEEALYGDGVQRSIQEPTLPGIAQRIGAVVDGSWAVSSHPTDTERRAFETASELFVPVLAGLRELVEERIPQLEERLEAAGAPWTPGRVPSYTKP